MPVEHEALLGQVALALQDRQVRRLRFTSGYEPAYDSGQVTSLIRTHNRLRACSALRTGYEPRSRIGRFGACEPHQVTSLRMTF